MDLEKIKQKIRPDEVVILKRVDSFLKKINEEIKKRKIKATAVVGGSIAKGTFIKGDYDIDIFVKFSKEYPNEKLSDILEKCIKKLKPERLHGSRDYFQIKKKELIFEVIPVYDIKSSNEAVNITDASTLHFKWVKEQIKRNPELKDEIRLARAFCKANGLYGAESYIRGFSGHVIDILTIYYGGFINLLKKASKWKEKEVIDFYNVYKGEALKKLNISKIQSPLIIIDPVQPERNAAASLSREIFYKFIEKANEFIKRPSEKFFEKKKFSLPSIKKKKAIIIKVNPLKGKKDVIGSKLLKAFEKIKKQLEINGFEIKDCGWHWEEEAYYWFVLKNKKISKTYVKEGPPLKSKNNVENFKKKHKKTFVEGKRIYAYAEREFNTAEKLLNWVLKKEDIKKCFRTARIIN
ncbi:MAG: CCA tRNA nucleotidyltransferase [Candidatus Woesearchaeota archaeon]